MPFVVFVSVPYTLQSYSEMPRPAGTDLHTNNTGLARGSGGGDTAAKWDKPSWRHPSHSRPPAKGAGELLCTRVDVATSVGTSRAACQVSQLMVPGWH